MSSTESLTRAPLEVSRETDRTVSAEQKTPDARDDGQPLVVSDAADEAAVQSTSNGARNWLQQPGSQLFDVCQYDRSNEASILLSPSTQCVTVPCAPKLMPSSPSPVPLTKRTETLGHASHHLSYQSPSLAPHYQGSKPGVQPSASVTSSVGVDGQTCQTAASEEPPVKVDYTDFSAKVVPSAVARKTASTSVPVGAAKVSAWQRVGGFGTLLLKRAHSDEILSLATDPALAKKTTSLTESRSKERQLSSATQRTSSPIAIGHENERFRNFHSTSYIGEATKGIASLESTQSELSIGPIGIGIFTSAYVPPQETHSLAHMRGIRGLPWATMFVILLQLLAHWKFMLEHRPERPTSVTAILKEGHWEHLLFAAFHHENVVHIASNVVCFLFKGLILEAVFGTAQFAHIFAIVVFLVGLVNVAIVKFVHEITSVSSLQEMDLNTFAGVAVALELLHRKRFPNATADIGLFEIGARPVLLVLCELAILWACSARNLSPIISGLLVGFLLGHTSAGKIICVPLPQAQLHLSAIARTPVTCLLVTCICVTHLCGPFLEPSVAEGPNSMFRDQLKQLSIPRLLYVGNVYHLAYIILSLLAVSHNLEGTLGVRRFSGLLVGLLFSVSVLGEFLPVLNWKGLFAFRNNLLGLEAVVHTYDCCCALTGAMLALKAIHHSWQPRSAYLMASFPINIPFWPGLLLELAHLHFNMHDGASFSHVTGAFFGFATAHLWRGHLVGCDAAAAPRTSSFGSIRGARAGLMNSANEHYD